MSSDLKTIMQLQNKDGEIGDILSTHNPLKDKLDVYSREIYDRFLNYLVNKNISDPIKFGIFIKFMVNNTDDIIAAVKAMEEVLEAGAYLDTIKNIGNDTLRNSITNICYRMEEHKDDRYGAPKCVAWYDLFEKIMEASARDYWNSRIVSSINSNKGPVFGTSVELL